MFRDLVTEADRLECLWNVINLICKTCKFITSHLHWTIRVLSLSIKYKKKIQFILCSCSGILLTRENLNSWKHWRMQSIIYQKKNWSASTGTNTFHLCWNIANTNPFWTRLCVKILWRKQRNWSRIELRRKLRTEWDWLLLFTNGDWPTTLLLLYKKDYKNGAWIDLF